MSQQLLKAVGPSDVLVAEPLHQGLAFVEELARVGEVAAGSPTRIGLPVRLVAVPIGMTLLARPIPTLAT